MGKWGDREEWAREIMREHYKTFGAIWYVYYHDRGDGLGYIAMSTLIK